MDAKQLANLIRLKQVRIAVFGMGYVGLPLTLAISSAGFYTVGADIDEEKLNKLKNGKNVLPDIDIDEEQISKLISSNKLAFSFPQEAAEKSDIKIICIPTPTFDFSKAPDLRHIRNIAKVIGPGLKKGDLVINESTVGPKTTRDILCTVLENESGLSAGRDFFVAASPERIDPGNPVKLEQIPKVVGGINTESTELATEFYNSFIEKVVKVSSLEIAEATKMLENSFRAVNIGFINEFANFCKNANLNISEIINAAATKPYGFMPFYPSIGVGGHCIPQDPYYLISAARETDSRFDVLATAVSINESMPQKVLELLKECCQKHNLEYKKTKVVIFGISYKKDLRDIRGSPALIFHNLAQSEGFDVYAYDRLFKEQELRNFGLKPFNLNEGCTVAVIGNDHTHVRNIDFSKLDGLKFIIDGKNILGKQHVPVFGIGKELPVG